MIPVFYFFGYKVFTYPFIMGAAWGIGYHISKFLNIKEQIFKKFNLLFMLIFVSAWIGAKIFFLLTADFQTSKPLISNSNFWLGGGFVFYGGLLTSLLIIFLYSRYKKIPLKSFSIFIPSLLIGHGLGRVGCLMAGCCYGIELEHESFYSVFMHEAHRFPVQLLEATLLLISGIFILKNFNKLKPNLIYLYLLLYSGIRLLTEFFRADGLRGIWFQSISTSQIISILMLIIVFVFYAVSRHKKLDI